MRGVDRNVLTAALAGLALLAGGCGGSSPGAPDEAVVVLFDLSESTNRPEAREAYCESFGRILSSIDHGDAVAAGWIVESSVTQPALPVDTAFPAFDPETTNPLMREAKRAEADSLLEINRDSLQARICSRLRSPEQEVMHTDVMTSLDLAARILEARGRPRKRLVILSDMIEDSDRYEFDEMSLTRERREEILHAERDAGRLPRLRGVAVCVVGASAPETDRYYRIEKFWRAYLEAAGAEVTSYGGPYVAC